jgi:hypothetical protein
MKIKHLLTESVVTEANVAAKIGKDPKMAKMLAIAFRHDNTLPKSVIAKLGPRPSDSDVLNTWSELLDNTLRVNNYGDLSADGKFDEWLTRLYINGIADYEDINGEGGDALGAWKALSTRGKLRPDDQDFNKFKSIKQLQRIRNDPKYREELNRIKDAEHINKMKREAKEVVILDNERFRAIVPLNYGSCYSTDKGGGYIPNFCTGSSSGASWFGRYAPDGIIVNVVDKENLDDVNGKWQFHAATNQIVRGDQERRHDISYNDGRFAELFPGLMKDIIAGLQSNAEEIKDGSKELTPGGYDVGKEIDLIKSKYPKSVASGEKEPEPEEEPPQDEPEAEQPQDEPAAENPDDTPGTWLVTQIASGLTARIPGENLADVHGKLLRKYPDSTIDDYTYVKQ